MKKSESTLSSANIQGQLLRREIADLANPSRILTLFQTLEALQDALQNFEAPQDVVAIATEFLVGLDIFQSFAFFYGEPRKGETPLAICHPPSASGEFKRIFSEQSSRGKFLFTVKQSRFVPVQVDYSQQRKWSIFQRIATDTSFQGVFIGIMEAEIDISRQTDFSLLSFVLKEIAHLLENAGLRDELQSQKSSLEKRVEERTAELAEAKIKAESSSRAKSEFLAVMSHELRTPLNGIFGFLSLFRDAKLDEVHADYLEKIQSSAESLRELIDDILDYSRIESGRLSVQGENVCLLDLIEGVFQVHAWPAVVNHNELVFHVDPDVPQWAIVDSARLQQILSNLLSNAIKFTHNGTIIARVSRATDVAPEEHGCVLRFEVEDTGIGIEPDKVPEMFEPFTQGDSSDRRRYGGTGLGLSIVKRLVNLMGGSIEAHNSARGGAIFSFTCPVQEAECLNPELLVPSARQKSVLLLEPNDAVAAQIEATLSKFDLNISRVTSLEDVLARTDFADFDYLFYDLAVHSRHGISEFKEILGDLSPACPPVVLIGTVDLFEEEFRSAGERVVGHILKPVRRREIGRLLDRLTNPDAGGSDEEADPASRGSDHDFGNRHPLEILVIDENPVSRKVLLLSLSSLGYRPLGVDSVRLAEDQTEIRKFDMIFADARTIDEPRRQGNLAKVCQLNAAASSKNMALLYLIGGAEAIPEQDSDLRPLITEVLHRPVSRPKIREVVQSAAALLGR